MSCGSCAASWGVPGHSSNFQYHLQRRPPHITHAYYNDSLTIVIIAYVLFTTGMKSGHRTHVPKSSNTHEGFKILLFKIDSRDLTILMGSKTLFATDFPLYTITPFGKCRIVVTGGGGSAKTGVPNALVSTLYSKLLVHRMHAVSQEVYEVTSDDAAHVVHRHTFTTELVMNAAVNPVKAEHVACGVDDKCYILHIYKEQTELNKKDKDDTVQKRKGPENDGIEDLKLEQFKVEVMLKEQSDFSKVDALQKAVCFSHDGAHVITGGADGCIRCWEVRLLGWEWLVCAKSILNSFQVSS